MDLLILATLALAAVALLLTFRRRSPVAAATALPARTVLQAAPRAPGRMPLASPHRIANPRRAARPDVKVWILRASPRCELTYSLLDGHRYHTEDAVPLPSVGCNLTDCQCHYEPISDTRRGERRDGEDRRALVRFEMRSDRRGSRQARERRNSDMWQHASLR
jgi:hypothetical protein